MIPCSIRALALANCSSVKWSSTVSSFSGSAITAPKAMAMGRPIMPVPGMPTPMAFFRILALRSSVIDWISPLRMLAACATVSATATGSVHPVAGSTSRCIILMILSCRSLSILVLMYVVCWLLTHKDTFFVAILQLFPALSAEFIASFW